jgi:hypothetical protein
MIDRKPNTLYSSRRVSGFFLFGARKEPMPRKDNLEQNIQESEALITEYEAMIRTSDRPEEKARARRIIREQRELIEGYRAELRALGAGAGARAPASQADPGTSPTAPQPTGGATYHIHIDRASGLAIGDQAQSVQQQSSPQPQRAAPPGITVTRMTDVVPTAYCYQLDAQAFPLVTVTVDNTGQGCANATLRILAAIEGYSDPAVALLQVAQGEQVRVPLLPLLKPERAATLNELRPSTLRVTVDQTSPPISSLYDRTQRIRLHARDTATLAVRAPDGGIVDLTAYLAAWVTPRRPEVERLLRQAAERHPDRRFVGYQGASALAQGAEIVRDQARAMFAMLKQDANLVYVNSPLNMGRQAGQVTQRVRLPTESLAAGGSANCIDGTVLFASLLELAAIDPLLVIVPGHAFVGWRIWRGVDRYEFLETTMIGSSDWSSAQQAAQARYDDCLLKGYFSRGLFDPGGFARLIDVAECRARGIMSLE